MKKIFYLILPILLFLTGCADYRELNNLAIITAMEVDKEDDNFTLISQIVNPKNQNDASSANQPAFITYKTKGKTLQEALRNLTDESSLKIYGRHLQVLIVTENLAKEDLTSIFDFFFRYVEVRKEFYMIVDTSQNDEKLLEIMTPIINLSSQTISSLIENNNMFMGISNIVTFNDMMDISLDKNKELTLPTIYTVGNVEIGKSEKSIEQTSVDTKIKLGNMAIFKNEKLLGYLTKNESLVVNLINNDAKNFLVINKCDDTNYVTSEITLDKTDMKIDTKNKKIIINLKGNGYITEYNCDKDLTDEKVIKENNNNLNKYIEQLVYESIININTNYNTDIYGIKDKLYKTNYKYYKQIENNYYDDFFNNLTFEIKSNFKLLGKGNILGGTYEKLEN